jgi:hypothetical protein
MASFTFNGVTVVAPSVLVRTIIGAQKALSLLPFGTIAFVGASDGGLGNGKYYRFSDYATAKRVLRGGAVLGAIEAAINGGGASGFVVVIAGAKTSAKLALGTGATLTAGDQGSWTNLITFTAVAGSTSGQAVTLTYPDPISGAIQTIGGLGTIYDNLASLSALQLALLSDGVVTPPASSPFPALVTLAITADGPIGLLGTTNLAGGTGNGSYTPVFADVVIALNALDEVAFDIGHLVGVYDATSQGYANGKARAHEAFGYLQRWIHQVRVPGANAGNTVQLNSEEVANTAIAAAASMNYFRASVVAQQIYSLDPNTGKYGFVDLAPVICGLAAFIGATDQWGPASPLTHVFLPTAADVDYPVLSTTGDRDRAITGGVMLAETIGTPATGNVRVVQSVTTQPIDPGTGEVWALSEFSCVRAADALLANITAAVDRSKPRAIGGGNTAGTMNSLIAKVVKVLELALDANWIVSYDPKSISINTAGPNATDDLIYYSAAITPPRNHIGITQSLIPFAANLNA